MKLLVLAGGFGTRLQSVVSEVPKALAPVGNVPFLHLQIEHWIDQGIDTFIFLLHHHADSIIDYLKQEQSGLLKACNVQWLVEPTPMGTGGAVAYAVEELLITGNFLVTNADTWLGTGCKDLYRAEAPSIAVVEMTDASRYGLVNLDDKNQITAFYEKCNSNGVGWINAGLCHLNADIFTDWNHLPFSLEQVSFPALSATGKLKAVPLKTDFIDIGIPDDYFNFCRWIKSERKGPLCS